MPLPLPPPPPQPRHRPQQRRGSSASDETPTVRIARVALLTLHWYVVLTFASPADATQEEEMSQADKAQVKEMLTTLRTEVDELAKTAWLYETNDSVAGCRVNV